MHAAATSARWSASSSAPSRAISRGRARAARSWLARHGTRPALARHWHGTGPALARYWPGTDPAWHGTGPAWHWHGSGPALARHTARGMCGSLIHRQAYTPSHTHAHTRAHAYACTYASRGLRQVGSGVGRCIPPWRGGVAARATVRRERDPRSWRRECRSTVFGRPWGTQSTPQSRTVLSQWDVVVVRMGRVIAAAKKELSSAGLSCAPLPTSAPGLGSPPPTSAPGLGSPLPTSAPGLGSPPPTSAPGLGSPPPTSAPGLGSPLPTAPSGRTHTPLCRETVRLCAELHALRVAAG